MLIKQDKTLIVPDIYNQQVVTFGFMITNNITIPNLEGDKGVAKYPRSSLGKELELIE